MISSLKERSVVGFQGVIAACGVLCVKEFAQSEQCHKTHAGSVVILQSSTELLINHPAWKYAVRPVGQCNHDVLGIESGYSPQYKYLASIEWMIAIHNFGCRRFMSSV
jgi:hypothetical protein